MPRTIFIGDIHGCLDELESLIQRLAIESSDRVFCAGDFMDRGPNPAGCVQLARALGFASVLGNHEEKHLRWRRHEQRRAADPSYQNPMRSLHPQSVVDSAALTDEDIAWLAALPVVLHPLPGWVLVHGGLFPKLTIEQQLRRKDKLIRLRWLDAEGDSAPLDDDTATDGPAGSQPWMVAYDGPDNVVYGHAVHSLSRPRVDTQAHGTRTLGIDTGCVFGGSLTALVIDDAGREEIVQVRAKLQYVEPRYPLAE